MSTGSRAGTAPDHGPLRAAPTMGYSFLMTDRIPTRRPTLDAGSAPAAALEKAVGLSGRGGAPEAAGNGGGSGESTTAPGGRDVRPSQIVAHSRI